MREITRLSRDATAILQGLAEETKKWGGLKAEAGKLEKELQFARYLVTGDDAVLKALPKQVVVAFLDRAATYCELNGLNPMVRVPEGLSFKYYSILSYAEVSLVDLIKWARRGLAGVSR
ncbi:MAG: hypothetical protein E3J65_06090 [Dehalococcoidia bacterium]|nr:MAG: hypothetical protein E3J65_06090 [Dehalococcoidia bacterium]